MILLLSLLLAARSPKVFFPRLFPPGEAQPERREKEEKNRPVIWTLPSPLLAKT